MKRQEQVVALMIPKSSKTETLKYPKTGTANNTVWVGSTHEPSLSSSCSWLGKDVRDNCIFVVIAICKSLDPIRKLGGDLLDADRKFGWHLHKPHVCSTAVASTIHDARAWKVIQVQSVKIETPFSAIQGKCNQ